MTALGGTAAFNFKLGKIPVTARLKLFEEFDAKHRMDGTVGFLSLTMPLHVKLPPGPAPPQ